MLPVALYGLKVTADGIPIPAVVDFPATFRITMAAIDPTAPPKDQDGTPGPPRATLKLIREQGYPPFLDDEDEESGSDGDDVDSIRRRLMGAISDDEDESEDDEDVNGGPSDPAKSKRARAEALVKKLLEGAEGDDDEEMDDAPNGVNGTKVNKGKAKAVDDDDESISDIEDDMEDGVEEFVICTLDPEKHYQQTLDITITEKENVYFAVQGTHDIYLTGNYVIPPHDLGEEESDEEDELDYDLEPDSDELDYDEESEEDELDGLEDPRVTEVDTDEEAPNLVIAAEKKGKNKRAAEDDLDTLISKSLKPEPKTNGEEKLSKKQLKKQKNNEGQAVPTKSEEKPIEKKAETKADKKAETKDQKKVQFAKNLEQGPTGSPKVGKENKTGLGVKMVQGVKVDEKKLGSGRAARKGDKVSMRYIGKLHPSGKQFDANKKGKPFMFTIGKGEVIKGWDIGVEGMAPGGERRITIPPTLGYGSKSIPDIPANSTLEFDIKLLGIH
ncbi:hypothetical protein M501DRAFT_943426 [Patellaria atrata CBS 101060]|uniref:peptidylprolyl isomerase n=1 Tax=Patellaria atrata CBS 101060 TaxID=1346257 RepID=A0A9P4S490_9PEZI|nr:hypothetical protein M501DRAFT_943426 [Patellaria atrata CBS 101060]